MKIGDSDEIHSLTTADISHIKASLPTIKFEIGVLFSATSNI